MHIHRFRIYFKPVLRLILCLIINNLIKLAVYFGRRYVFFICILCFCEEFYTACKFIQGSIPLQGTMACFCFLLWKRVDTISHFYFLSSRNYPSNTLQTAYRWWNMSKNFFDTGSSFELCYSIWFGLYWFIMLLYFWSSGDTDSNYLVLRCFSL